MALQKDTAVQLRGKTESTKKFLETVGELWTIVEDTGESYIVYNSFSKHEMTIGYDSPYFEVKA